MKGAIPIGVMMHLGGGNSAFGTVVSHKNVFEDIPRKCFDVLINFIDNLNDLIN